MSKHLHFYEIVAGADNSRAMESETIQKNGASPKSHTSRGNFFEMKKIVFFAFALMGLGVMNVTNGQYNSVTTYDAKNITQTEATTTICEEEKSMKVNMNEPLLPCVYSAITNNATNVTLSTATLNGSYVTTGEGCIYSKSFVVSREMTIMNVSLDSGTFFTNLTGLTSGATYQFRAVLNGVNGYVYGETLFFTTLIVATLDATNITSFSATLNGISNLGDATVIKQGFILTTPTGSDTITVSNNTTTLTYDVTDLPHATIFSYKTYCTTINETVYGEEVKFATLFNQDGTTNLIENIDDMLALAKFVGEGYSFEEQKFKLVNSITLPTTPNNINAIGSFPSHPFCGEFDGNDKAIYNVYIDHPNTPYQGLFGYALNADIHNLGIVNITASGRNYTGGMIAYAENSKITDCHVSGGTLYALSYCGGLIGYQTPGTNSIITSCYNNFCTVTGNNYVGGLLGYSDKGTVRNSYVVTPVFGIPGTTGAIIGGSLDVLFYNYGYDTTITDLPPIGDPVISGKRGDGDGGMSSEEMRTEEFVNMLNQGLVIPAWKMDYNPPINDGFPILIWQQQATGIGDLVTESNIILYPNPTTGILQISCYSHCGLNPQSPENDEIAGQARNDIQNIAIFDVMGRAVHVETLRATSLQPQIEMNISHLPTGIYFLRIMTDEGVVVRKVVKE